MLSDVLRRLMPIAAGVLLTAGEVRAGRGLVIITWGETIDHVGQPSAPAELAGEKGLTLQVGYKYGYAGLFWIDFWTWGGTYCVYDGKNYRPIDAYAAADLLGCRPDDLSRPFLYRWPLGWLIVGPLVVIWFVTTAPARRRARLRTHAQSRLAQDPNYQAAVRTLAAEYNRLGEPGNSPIHSSNRYQAAFAVAVRHLIDAGVPPAEAERNLTSLVGGPETMAWSPEEGTGLQIQCDCGAAIPVTLAMAGTTASCACGRQIPVPSLRKLQAM